VLQFTKARGFAAPDPFKVRLNLQDGECTLERSYADLASEISALLDQGLLQKDIAKRLGVSPSTITRHKRKGSGRARRIIDAAQGAEK
jgi:FixJ family two-component response regulator